MKKIGFTVPDMSCGHCVERIRRALEEIGIETEIDLQSKTVILDEKDEEKARRRLDEIDYPVKSRFDAGK
ncbi:MAG: heavy-metal-associated domain-containing protein [Synergistaceae bacterium]|jgi:copper chaperone CopZ|nr:heavy-metal-associated domain-containing protein [Synergistaceae bacterium]